MAGRPIKQGLDYFPLDVDFFSDDKIEYVTARFDEKGELIAIKLLCNIYRNGYFMNWDDDKATIFAKRAGRSISPALAKDVVGELVKRGFFEENIFNSFNILTSRGIQKRYMKAAAERTEIEIIYEYWLINFPTSTNKQKIVIKHTDNSIYRPINSNNQPSIAESREKESKEQDSIKDVVGAEAPTAAFAPDSIEYKSAKYLADKILERNPNAVKIPRDEKGLLKWCVHIDYLIRLDKRPLDELRAVLVFAVKDPFWSTNILSTKKLRDKYDTLLLQMQRGKEGGGNGVDNGHSQQGFNPDGMSGFTNALDRIDDDDE